VIDALDAVRVLLDETSECDEVGPIATGRFNAYALHVRSERRLGYAEDLSLAEALVWGSRPSQCRGGSSVRVR
jgi:hypothetical protein